MPGSVKHGKQDIKEWLDKQDDIELIVDVGAGGATYPNLLGSKYTYIAIEIFSDYVDMFNLREIYSQIIIDDVVDVVKNNKLPSGDCIIFGDVLEHIIKEDALEVLNKAIEKYPHVIVSIPIGNYPAQEHYGNVHELHISTWEFKELQSITDWEVAKIARDIGIFIK